MIENSEQEREMGGLMKEIERDKVLSGMNKSATVSLYKFMTNTNI